MHENYNSFEWYHSTASVMGTSDRSCIEENNNDDR